MAKYRPRNPFDSGYLPVSDLHTIYYEQFGNPTGKPVVVLHGGPGAASKPDHARRFDPKIYRVVLFDQRGCGKSTPQGELRDNTTLKLASDMEKLREHLGIKNWLVAGGSWGSLLGIAYAVTYPKHVTGLILWGIFLGRKKEFDWMYKGGAAKLFPDTWRQYVEHIPRKERGDLLRAYYRRLTSPNARVRQNALERFAHWQLSISQLTPQIETFQKEFASNKSRMTEAQLAHHYFVHKVFIERDDFLLRKAAHLQVPALLLHGRYDLVTTLETAWELHQTLPKSELHIVTLSGHRSSKSPAMEQAIIEATDRFAKTTRVSAGKHVYRH